MAQGHAAKGSDLKSKAQVALFFVAPMLSLLGNYYLRVPARATPKGPESLRELQDGDTKFKSEILHLLDHSRPMQAYDRYAGAQSRTLECEIWRPEVARKNGPLVVYSHGFMSDRREGLYLIRFLASHGYTVVAIDYPLTGRSAPDKPFASDFVNQPGDISFLLDHLLKRNADPADEFHGTIDPAKIAVAGVSLGCLTSMLATYHRDLLDPRIAAAICIAGPTNLFTPTFFENHSIPTLLIYGDKDSVVEYGLHAVPARRKIPNSILVTLREGSHCGFAQQASTVLRFMKNPDSLACMAIRMRLGDKLRSESDHVAMLGGAEAGVVETAHYQLPRKPLIAVAMKASRQQMFTKMAAHAFLDSLFAGDATRRRSSRKFLLKSLPAENAGEVRVEA